MLGLNPTPESIAFTDELIAGEHKASKDSYSSLKNELDVTRKWWQGRSGRIEVPRVNNERLVFFIGRCGVRHMVDALGPTTFVDAKKLYRQHPTKFLETVQRNETAQYLRPRQVLQYGKLRPADTLDTFRYAETSPKYPDRPLIRLVGDTTQSPAGRARIKYRKEQIEHRQLLYRRERHGLRMTEHGKVVELHNLAKGYKGQLGDVGDAYMRERDKKIKAFFRAKELTQRGAAIEELKDVTTSSANNLLHVAASYRNQIEAAFDSITSIATASLNQDDRNIVQEVTKIIDAAFADTGIDAIWNRKGFDAVKVKDLLPKRSVPFASERAELVRDALSKRIAHIAETLASYGRNADAEQMLLQFKKVGILHKYAYEGIKVMSDQAYILHTLDVQNERVVPGRGYAYLTAYGTPHYAGKIPPAGERNRKALNSEDADFALEVVIDGKIMNQVDFLQHNQNNGAQISNSANNMLLVVSSMHDKRAAAAYRAFFEASFGQPKKELSLPVDDKNRPADNTLTLVRVPVHIPPKRHGIRKILRF